MKLIYFGTSEFAVPTLQTIKEQTDWEIGLVVTESAKPVGRKQEITESSVSAYAKLAGLKVITPPSLKSAEVESAIKSAQADVMIVAAYGKIIPPEIIKLPPHGIINIHPSLLPQLRGPSPIQTTLKDGLKETGVSLMVIDEKIDHGPVISQEAMTIGDNDNYITLEQKLAELGGQMLIRDLPRYISGKLKPQEQNHAQATFTKMIKKEDGLVDWSKPASEIYNQHRAFIKWPGIYTFFENKLGTKTLLKLHGISVSRECDRILVIRSGSQRGHATPDTAPERAGEVFTDERKNLFIACSQDAIQLVKIQPEGGKILTPKEFLNGYGDIVGQVLQ